MELENKIIVVTGGASGIGREMCRRFAREGAKKVVVADLDAAGAAAVAEEIDGIAMGVDVSDESQIVNLIETTENDVGPIDLFCSNAGIGIGQATARGLENRLIASVTRFQRHSVRICRNRARQRRQTCTDRLSGRPLRSAVGQSVAARLQAAGN